MPRLTASYSGLVKGDSPANLTTPPTLTTTATASSHVLTGGYAITAAGASDPDYAITYKADTLTITPAPLTIMANNTSQPFGTTPSLSASFIGLVNGDTAASLAAARGPVHHGNGD